MWRFSFHGDIVSSFCEFSDVFFYRLKTRLVFHNFKSNHLSITLMQELLNDTYKHIAEQYEMKGNLKKAEHYYVEAHGLCSFFRGFTFLHLSGIMAVPCLKMDQCSEL